MTISTDTADIIAQLTSRIQRLEDIAAIQRLKTRYAASADSLFRSPSDELAARMLELFSEDCHLDLGPFGQFSGRERVKEALTNVLPAATVWSTHYIVNHEVDVQGDTAEARFYLLLQMQSRSPEGAPPVPATLVHGQYEDRFVRTAEGWKIRSVRAILHPPR